MSATCSERRRGQGPCTNAGCAWFHCLCAATPWVTGIALAIKQSCEVKLGRLRPITACYFRLLCSGQRTLDGRRFSGTQTHHQFTCTPCRMAAPSCERRALDGRRCRESMRSVRSRVGSSMLPERRRVSAALPLPPSDIGSGTPVPCASTTMCCVTSLSCRRPCSRVPMVNPAAPTVQIRATSQVLIAFLSWVR